MTEEQVIKFDGEYKIESLSKRMLDDSDLTSKNTNKTISIKLVDDKNNIFLLIEACNIDYIEDENRPSNKGCFIKRFIFEESLIGTEKWHEILKSFITGVRYSMIECLNKSMLCRYRYIWAQKNIDEKCFIAEALGLKLQDDNITYIEQLPNQ